MAVASLALLVIIILSQKASVLKNDHSDKLWMPDFQKKSSVLNDFEFYPHKISSEIHSDAGKRLYITQMLNGVSLKLPQTDENAYLFLNDTYSVDDFSDEYLAKIYEEELPEEILDDASLPKDYHIYARHKPVTQMQIEVKKKPPYFGSVPLLAVVIDDMGVSPKRSRAISSLQAPLTASFLTYIKNANQQIALSKNSGQEIILHVPMEPKIHQDTAPDMLTTAMEPQEIQERLRDMLERFPDIRGINNHMGSKLTADKVRMQAVMKILEEKQIFFLDSKTSAASVAEEAAAENGVAYAHRHVFLDNKNEFDYITRQLQQTEKIARKHGYAIAIGHPKTQTFEALRAWLPSLEEKNIKLVHLSEIINILNPTIEKQP